MIIRKATIGDVDAIAAQYIRLFSEMADMQPDCLKPAEQKRNYIRGAVNSPDHLLLVAEKDGGGVAGFVLAQEQQSPPYPCLKPRRLAYLMDMAVSPDCRELGLGSSFIEQVKIWALNRGLEYVELNVLEENTRAIGLYERCGFKSAMRSMRFKLGRPD